MTRRAGALSFGVWLIAVASAAEYGPLYNNGVRAYQRNRFEDAEASFRAALREEDKEALRAISSGGGIRDPYLPYFYLGAALAHQGKCADARTAFAASVSQGVLQKTREYTEYLQLAKACRDAAPRSATSSLPLPTQPIEKEPTPLHTLTTAPMLVTADDSSVRPTVGIETNSSTNADAPTPPLVLGARRPAVAGVPPALLQSFDLLVRGRYADAIAVLNGITDTRPRIRGEIHLLRSAARFALFELEGRIRPSLEVAARADAVMARGLLPRRGMTMPEAFSPKFRRFLADAK